MSAGAFSALIISREQINVLCDVIIRSHTNLLTLHLWTRFTIFHLYICDYLSPNLKTMELRGMKGSIMVQWTSILQTIGLCYGWQEPLLCLKLDPYTQHQWVLWQAGRSAGWQTKKLLLQKFSKSDDSTPNVSLDFQNRFLAFVRLYQYVFGQFFVIVLF